jgi:hypothetical protein
MKLTFFLWLFRFDRAYVEDKRARNQWGSGPSMSGGMHGHDMGDYGSASQYRPQYTAAPSGMPSQDWMQPPVPSGVGMPARFDYSQGYGGMAHPGMSYPPTNQYAQQQRTFGHSMCNNMQGAPHSDPIPGHAANGMRIDDPEEEELSLGPGQPPNRPVSKMNAPNAMGPA